jgi:hypothetical protein
LIVASGDINPAGTTALTEGPTVSRDSSPDTESERGGDELSGSGFLGRRWVFETAYAALVLAAAVLILSLVGRRAGWPLGQQYNRELTLVPIYAAHFRHLDFFPVWSSSDGLGLGTPVLLFYQKAFFYVSGFLYIVLGGALKPTLVLSIAIFLVVGAYGMRRALETITDSRLLCTVGSVGFLFTNYVFTDWLARGDLPEFAALMIVPWLLYWCLNLVIHQKVSLLLIPIVVLLVDAHSAIALISLFTLAIAFATFLLTAGLRGLRAIAVRMAIAVGATILLLAPMLVAELRFSQVYDPADKVTHYANISNDYTGFGSYFVDNSYRWLSSNTHNYVQIDYVIWVPLVLCIIGLGFGWLVTRPRPVRWLSAHGVPVPATAFLCLSLLVYLFLQLRRSLFAYDILSPLKVIDYPYRMLAFITPIGVILLVIICQGFVSRYPGNVLPQLGTGAWLVILILLSPITSTWDTTYGILAPLGQFPSVSIAIPPSRINLETYHGLTGSSFDGILFDEYLPKVYSYSSGVELFDDAPLYKEIREHQDGAESLSRVPCSVRVPTKLPLESLELTFRVTCRGSTQLALPISYNAYSTAYVKDARGNLHQIPYFRVASDPRLIIDVGSPQPEVVVVHLPTLWGSLF